MHRADCRKCDRRLDEAAQPDTADVQMPPAPPCASGPQKPAHVPVRERGQKQHLHEVACMVARAAAGQLQNETPDDAANIVTGVDGV